MKQNFAEVLAFTLQYEGGFVDDPRDPGGATNMGVTLATLSQYLGHGASVMDVRRMTRDTAAEIYRLRYWNAIGADALPSGVDCLAFDIAVNSGVGRAKQWLTAVSPQPAHAQIAALDQLRRTFWRKLPIFRTFGKGWTRREDACLALALKLQRGNP